MPGNVKVHFDWVNLPASAADGTRRVTFRERDTIFAQGDKAEAVFYIEHGSVKKIYVSLGGKERIVGVLKPGEFFGIGCLTGRQKRGTMAVAMSECAAIRIEKRAMLQLIYDHAEFADIFIAFLIDQSHRYERDLLDHLFSSSERRLARALLLLSDLGEDDGQKTTLPRVSQETLADIVGTTRSRINFFMNKFRQEGVIEYDGRIRVLNARLHAVVGDQTEGESKS
jgi:CRP-like cAMP-binding protein